MLRSRPRGFGPGGGLGGARNRTYLAAWCARRELAAEGEVFDVSGGGGVEDVDDTLMGGLGSRADDNGILVAELGDGFGEELAEGLEIFVILIAEDLIILGDLAVAGDIDDDGGGGNVGGFAGAARQVHGQFLFDDLHAGAGHEKEHQDENHVHHGSDLEADVAIF